MSEGMSFNIHAQAIGKVRRPTVESLTAGTHRLSVVYRRPIRQMCHKSQIGLSVIFSR